MNTTESSGGGDQADYALRGYPQARRTQQNHKQTRLIWGREERQWGEREREREERRERRERREREVREKGRRRNGKILGRTDWDPSTNVVSVVGPHFNIAIWYPFHQRS